VKTDLYHDLVTLGRQYNPGALFPIGKLTKSDLTQRIALMKKALDLKETDRQKSYTYFSAAWTGRTITEE
jgi:hypothetical protein